MEPGGEATPQEDNREKQRESESLVASLEPLGAAIPEAYSEQ